MPPQELTRRAMYDLVWSRPMKKVAEEFRISDVALKKICDKHRVPTPPRGYWAKKEAGKPVREAHFHETVDPQDEHTWCADLRMGRAKCAAQIMQRPFAMRRPSFLF